MRLQASALATLLMLLLMLLGVLPSDGPSGTPAPSGPMAPPATGAPAPGAAEPAPAEPSVPEPQPVTRQPLRGYTIVLDPGHGGRDPGAVGVSGRTWEKYNTWFVALDAKSLLEQAGAEVVLTRSGDAYIPLADRVRIARQHGADLYISIHNDWNQNAAIRGATTYYYHDQSRALAEVMQEELVRKLGTRSVGVLRQPFYVIRNAAMPAVLLELGFLSNREEEARLADPAYRWQAAEAIYSGVVRYLTGS